MINGLAICAGIGGLELGLRLAIDRYRTVCYVERDCFAAATLVARMGSEAMDQAPVWDDIGTFDGRRWRGVVDIVTAGFPCQPFSTAGGPRRKTADERWIWPEITRVIREVRPGAVLLENPTGIRAGLGIILRDLARLGFDAVWDELSASETGLPHRRKRVFILGYNNGRRGLEIQLTDGDPGEDVLEEQTEARRQVGGTLRRSSSGRIRLLPDGGFRGMAHGFPEILERSERYLEEDRLRCLGNAVAPIVAAHAMRHLLGVMAEVKEIRKKAG